MDMSQYLDMFLEESVENLQALNEGILELEKNPDDKDTINSIFRVAHTLKGMAGSMGFSDIAELTHKMENVLDKFRNDQLQVTSDVVTVLFKCLDTLEKMVTNVKEGNNETVEIEELINMLLNIGNGNAINSSGTIQEENKSDVIKFDLNEYDKNIIKQAKQKNYNVYRADISIYKDCVLKSARAFLVYKTLEDMGELIKTIPSTEDLENENFDSKFTVVFVTMKTVEEIKATVESISEIESVVIEELEAGTSNVEVAATASVNNVKEQVQEVKKDSTIATKNNETKQQHKEEVKVRKATQSVRVDLERLDKFMTLVGELVIQRTRLEQLSQSHKLTDLHETLEQVGRLTTDLQDLVMKVRMLPVETVFNRFPRMVRDLSKELNKEIELIIEGENTELDRTVIDEIGEPLVHLLRNSVDHGIEAVEERMKSGKNSKGTIRLVAYQEGNKAIIKVEDDGKGLNVEKIKEKAHKIGVNTEGMTDSDIKSLIFMQGFSTSEKVTDVSGRGVGMDVVNTKISSLGGTIEIISEERKGTAIIIKLPLTLSIIQALLVRVGGETFAISLDLIDRVINKNVDDIKKTNNKEVIIYRDSVIPVVRVATKLKLEEEESKDKFIVIVKVGDKTIGLLVDSLFGQQEIVIKSIGKTLTNLKEYVGATILGDGLVTLILDVASIV